MTASKLTPERLKELLRYDPETGIFISRVRTSRRTYAGTILGCFDKYSYVVFRVDGKLYKAHRLAWLYMTGEWPKYHIDHIDGNPHNNRWNNLRDVTHAVNLQNVKHCKRDNQSGFLGVRARSNGTFRAGIFINGKQLWLGTFKTAEEAHDVYLEAKRKLHKGCTI